MTRLGTRGSALARAQCASVAARLEAIGQDTETHVIRTAGDRVRDARFSEIGAPGIFVREIETALLEGHIDAAVHSYKDLPSSSPESLTIAAVPERVDPADCLIMQTDAFDAGAPPLLLRAGSTVATGSARREALLNAMGTDLRFEPLRGNVPTRLDKLRSGSMHAIVLARAGLVRLERDPVTRERVSRQDLREVRLDPAVFVPAPGQGAIAVQCRADDTATVAALAAISDSAAVHSLFAERRLLSHVQGGCEVPFGAWCELLGDGSLRLHAALQIGESLVTLEAQGADPSRLADDVWQRFAAARADSP